MKKIKKIIVSGWWVKRNYSPFADEVIYFTEIKKETEKAILIGSNRWIPKNCIVKIEDFDRKLLKNIIETSRDKKEVLKKLKLEDKKTFLYFKGEYAVVY